MKKLRLLVRAVVLLAILAVAAGSVLTVLRGLSEHARLQREVQTLTEERQALISDYSGTVETGQKLKNNPEAQVELLKERMGYARSNETPIVVTLETP